MLVLSSAAIERLLSMSECIGVVEEALHELHHGDIVQPLRMSYVPIDGTGAMLWMPAYRRGDAPLYGAKCLYFIPGNPSRGLDSHQGQVLLADGATGRPTAILNASTITAIRTAAASAVATRVLARADARELAIVGTGIQARRHIDSIPLVRPIERIRVAGRSKDRADAFVRQLGDGHSFAVEASANCQAAVRDADIVVTATSSKEPVLFREWLKPGVHLNAVGASQPPNQELDPAIFGDALVVTDRRESLEAEATDYRKALEQGIGAKAVELGELLRHETRGRSSDEQVTVFRSLGLAAFDLAAAEYVRRKAEDIGDGVDVDF